MSKMTSVAFLGMELTYVCFSGMLLHAVQPHEVYCCDCRSRRFHQSQRILASSGRVWSTHRVAYCSDLVQRRQESLRYVFMSSGLILILNWASFCSAYSARRHAQHPRHLQNQGVQVLAWKRRVRPTCMDQDHGRIDLRWSGTNGQERFGCSGYRWCLSGRCHEETG